MPKIAIIGGGPAGFFAALRIKSLQSEAEVYLIEQASRPLVKLGQTGGGRCNITNTFKDITNLRTVYPRGHRLMQRMLHRMSALETMAWFEHHGLPIMVQEDNRAFPRFQQASAVIDMLIRLAQKEGIKISCGTQVERLLAHDDGTWSIHCSGREDQTFDYVILATGGHGASTDRLLAALQDITVVSPAPSLFGMSLKGNPFVSLSGTSVEHALLTMPGTSHRAEGQLLLTHHGISGPATLRLSAYAARDLTTIDASATIAIAWSGTANTQLVAESLTQLTDENAQKQVDNLHPHGLTRKLWQYLLERADVITTKPAGELSKKERNRLATLLTGDIYTITEKNRNKEEFVTAGGIALSGINLKTLQCKTHPTLYVVGEALDIDGVTGGFNLQAAWSTGWVAGESVAKACSTTGNR